MTDELLYDVVDGIGTITLNRPDAMNAFTSAMMRDFEAALRSAEDDDTVHVVVIKGAGPAFCAGADISGGTGTRGATDDGNRGGERWTATETTVYEDFVALRGGGSGGTSTWSLRKPVIAQVHGLCIGAGHDIAGQCDIIIAAKSARFIHPEVRSLGVTWRHLSVYYAGPQWAKIMMFTGDPITGEEAERIGLVAKAVPDERLDEEVHALAARIALVPIEILALNKATINKAIEGMGLPGYLEFGAAMDAMAHGTQPFKAFFESVRANGLAAALEERDGAFKRLPRPFRSEGDGS